MRRRHRCRRNLKRGFNVSLIGAAAFRRYRRLPSKRRLCFFVPLNDMILPKSNRLSSEQLAEITAIVRQKITESADPEKVKTAWTGVREKLGVERISDLKSEPAKLLQALAAAKKL